MEALKARIRNHRHGQGFHLGRGGARLGFLSPSDRITMNRERLLADAKARALELARAGYRAAGAAHRHSGAGREHAGHARSWACT